MDDKTIVPNAPFWAEFFCARYARLVEGLRTGAFEKVQPAFKDIEAEAEAAAETEYERLGALPSDGETDMGDVAEQAHEYGIEYYETMSDVRQAVLNVLVVGLHHLLEQHQLSFFQQLAGRAGKAPPDLHELLLTRVGIDTRSFSSAPKLHELRLAANAIKHGHGRSATELAALRPDLFKDATLSELGLPEREGAVPPSHLEPLAGEGLYVTGSHLSQWFDAVIAYWEKLAEALMEQWRS